MDKGTLISHLQSVEEIPLGQGDSREVEFGPHRTKPSEQDVQDFLQGIRQRATLLDKSDAISGYSSYSQEVSNRRLVVVRERLLQGWY